MKLRPEFEIDLSPASPPLSRLCCATGRQTSRRHLLRGGVDATNLSRWFGEGLFDLIVFQFPNVGNREPIYDRNPNHVLVRRFLRSATKHLTASGRIAVTVVNSPHYDGAFDMNGATELNGCKIPIAHPFYFADYPGYSHIKTKDDGSSALEEKDEFVTYVFRQNGEAARQWMSR